VRAGFHVETEVPGPESLHLQELEWRLTVCSDDIVSQASGTAGSTYTR
jgi:hypothetical protein